MKAMFEITKSYKDKLKKGNYMEKKSQIEHLIINPMEILSLIEENFNVKLPRSILDFQYNIATFVFSIRFYYSKT